jgi:hypothetical protein
MEQTKIIPTNPESLTPKQRVEEARAKAPNADYGGMTYMTNIANQLATELETQINISTLYEESRDNVNRKNERLQSQLTEVWKLADELAKSEDCPHCGNRGWLAVSGNYEQIQCEWCYTTSNSRFKALTAYTTFTQNNKKEDEKV